MKKLVVGGLVAAAALFVVAKTTSMTSYTGTLWSKARCEAKRQVPTKFELDRIRHEIKNLDGDLDNMIRPVAEYKAVIERLRRDLERGDAKLSEQKQTLLTMTEDLKAKPTKLVYAGKTYRAETIQAKLSNDFDSYKRVETHLAAQRKLLEAKETSLRASQEQLLKVVNKKKEFEVRLAQLEAEEETLQVARIGTDIRIDSGRATQIEDALRGVEERHDVERHEIEMRTNGIVADQIPVHQRGNPGVDVDAIRAYLEGNADQAVKTVQNGQ